MALVEKRFRFLYGTLFMVFVLFGTSMTIIGATLPKILEDFGWDYAVAGVVLGAGAIGYFMSTYAAGFLISIIGPKATILLGLSLELVGLSLFASIQSVPANIGFYLLVGLGQGCIELVVNWSTLRMERSGSGRAMNLMHGAFAVGAFIGPFVIGLLIGARLSWTLVYRGIAILFIIVAALMFFMPFAELRAEGSSRITKRPGTLFRHAAYWLGFLTLLLYVGVEIGVSNWVAEYFVKAFGADAATGSFMVSLFWAGLLAGRFGVPLLYRGNRSDLLLLLMAALMTASVTLLSGFGFLPPLPFSVGIGAALVFLAGLGCSGIYPIVVTFVGGAFPDAQSEAIAFASMGGGIGLFAFPFVMANISAGWGIRAGFTTYAVFAFVMVVSIVALLRTAHRDS